MLFERGGGGGGGGGWVGGVEGDSRIMFYFDVQCTALV